MNLQVQVPAKKHPLPLPLKLHIYMSSALRIEPARHGDAPRIAELCRDEVELDLGWQWRAGAIARLMARAETEVAVARNEDGEPVGFGIMELGPEDAELVLFATAPEIRRQGVGSRVLSFLETEAKNAGIESVWLHVRAANTGAISFYETHGYQIRDRLRAHYGGREDAFRMRHRLVQADSATTDALDLSVLLRGGRGSPPP